MVGTVVHDPTKYTGEFGVYRDERGGQPIAPTTIAGGSIADRIRSYKHANLTKHIGETLPVMVSKLRPL